MEKYGEPHADPSKGKTIMIEPPSGIITIEDYRKFPRKKKKAYKKKLEEMRKAFLKWSEDTYKVPFINSNNLTWSKIEEI